VTMSLIASRVMGLSPSHVRALGKRAKGLGMECFSRESAHLSIGVTTKPQGA
jgi:hypothetical protein